MTNNFEVDILASGSKGNSTLIKAGNTAVLIDAGISTKRIVEGLHNCGVEPEDLSGILITHEHRDHVAGLDVWGKRYPTVPIFANERTWCQLPCRRNFTSEQVRVFPRGCVLGNIRIESFKISHDAVDPVGYKLYYKDDKCTYLTDCGYVTKECKEAAEGSQTLILEANHDEDMLRHGSYPIMIQERILGEYGHLSNTTAGNLLVSLKHKPDEVMLAHLSEQNNTVEVAYNTVHNILEQQKETIKLALYVARQNMLVTNK